MMTAYISKNYLREDVKKRLVTLNSYGVSEDDVKRDVEIFRNWAEKQQHLPKDFLNDDLYIERLLVNNKFRMEQSKMKYDNYFTLKTAYNILYHDIEKIVPSRVPVAKLPLRNLTKDGKRIILICVATNKKNPDADLKDCLKVQLATTEIVNKYCFSDGRIAVLDFKGLRSEFFKNFEVLLLYKYLKMMKNGFSGRVSVLHIVNMTNFANLILNGVKMVLQEDISAKIKVHENLESFYKEIPQELLPKDYGGEDISISEYLELWDDIIKEEEQYLKNLRYQCADETARVGTPHLNSQEFGVEGTFRKLNID